MTPVFANDDAWFAEYEALKALPERIAEYRGTLGKSAKDLLAFLKFEDEVTLRLSSLLGYASCKGDEDTSNNFYQDMRGKATGTWVNISGALSFATPEIMAIDEKVLDSFYKDEPELETYRRSLYQIRRRAAHILSDEGEKLLAAAGEMADAPDRIRSTCAVRVLRAVKSSVRICHFPQHIAGRPLRYAAVQDVARYGIRT